MVKLFELGLYLPGSPPFSILGKAQSLYPGGIVKFRHLNINLHPTDLRTTLLLATPV